MEQRAVRFPRPAERGEVDTVKLRSYLAAAAMKLGLPADIAAGLPHMEVNGFQECSVDRHTGILEYNEERIVVGLNIDCLVVTGDHSTPAKLASHSFHPVPTMIVSNICRTDSCQKFGETEANNLGGLGHFQAIHLMPLAMAHANRLGKFGA